MESLRKNAAIIFMGVAAALASVGARAQTQAQAGPYAEAGLTQLTLSASGYSVKPTNALVRVGYNFTRNFAVEGMATGSVSSDSLQGVSFKVDSGYGAYLKAQVAVVPNFELFARAGWVHATISVSTPGIAISGSDSGFSYGAGAQFLFTRNWYGQADYVSYYNKDGGTIKGPSVSVGYRF